MAAVVLVHGVGQHGSSRAEQEQVWVPSLVKGVLRSGHPASAAVASTLAAATDPGRAALAQMAFYGDLFLSSEVQGGEELSGPESELTADELTLAVLGAAAARGQGRVAAEARQALRQVQLQTAEPAVGEAQGSGGVLRGGLAALDDRPWLAAQIFGLAQRAVPAFTQMARYLADDELRERIGSVVAALIDGDTRIVVAHSLGSIVAWEVCHLMDRPLPLLLTLGSPLGIGTVVYPRLRPQPPGWPGCVERWMNVAHHDDFIAVEPALDGLFASGDGRRISDHMARSRIDHHGITGYLEEPAAGGAIAAALST